MTSILALLDDFFTFVEGGYIYLEVGTNAKMKTLPCFGGLYPEDIPVDPAKRRFPNDPNPAAINDGPLSGSGGSLSFRSRPPAPLSLTKTTAPSSVLLYCKKGKDCYYCQNGTCNKPKVQ